MKRFFLLFSFLFLQSVLFSQNLPLFDKVKTSLPAILSQNNQIAYVNTPYVFSNTEIHLIDAKGTQRFLYESKEVKIKSNLIPLNDKWYFLSSSADYTADKVEYQIVELNNRAEFLFQKEVMSCEEKLGENHFYGVVNYTTKMPFAANLYASNNQKYILSVASKLIGFAGLSFNPEMGAQLSNGISYADDYANYSHTHTLQSQGVNNFKDYDQSEEVCHFSLMDTKLNVLTKGSYSFGVKRDKIRSLSAHVDDDGNIFLILDVRQEFVGKTNRIIIVKIGNKSVAEERIELNLDVFNANGVKHFIEGNKLSFVGFVCKEEDEGKGLSGVFYSRVNLNDMKIQEKNVSLFDSSEVLMINKMYEYEFKPVNPADGKVMKSPHADNKLVKEKDISRALITPFFCQSIELLGDSSCLIAMQFRSYWDQLGYNESYCSKIIVLRIDELGKKKSAIYQFGEAEKNTFVRGMSFLKNDNNVSLIFNGSFSKAPMATYQADFNVFSLEKPLPRVLSEFKKGKKTLVYRQSSMPSYIKNNFLIYVVESKNANAYFQKHYLSVFTLK